MLYIENFHIKKHAAHKSKGVWTIAHEKNCPQVRVRVRVGEQFSSGAIVLEPDLRWPKKKKQNPDICFKKFGKTPTDIMPIFVLY